MTERLTPEQIDALVHGWDTHEEPDPVRALLQAAHDARVLSALETWLEAAGLVMIPNQSDIDRGVVHGYSRCKRDALAHLAALRQGE